jgi:hypothetical protein
MGYIQIIVPAYDEGNNAGLQDVILASGNERSPAGAFQPTYGRTSRTGDAGWEHLTLEIYFLQGSAILT